MTDQEMRRLAEAAPRGLWWSQPSEHEPARGVVYGPDGDSLAVIEWNPGNDYDPVATAAYIAAASPDRVLALLDRIEALERERDAAAAPYVAALRARSKAFHDKQHHYHDGPGEESWAKCRDAVCRSDRRLLSGAATSAAAAPRSEPTSGRMSGSFYGLPRVSDLSDTLCFLDRHDHLNVASSCGPSRLQAGRILRALQARHDYQHGVDKLPVIEPSGPVIGRVVDEHYHARRAADPKGPPLHECGTYCGADIAERLVAALGLSAGSDQPGGAE